MGRDGKFSAEATRKHTVLIDTPSAMWEKLAWDIDVFQDIQRTMPQEGQPLAYAAINVCIAADSLKNWAETHWKNTMRASSTKFGEKQFDTLIKDNIQAQHICTEIANTSKHFKYRDQNWINGEAKIIEIEGDEDWPTGFELRYDDGTKCHVAYELFDTLLREWWLFLCILRIANGPQPSPAWQQNKLRRIFGNLDIPIES